MAAKSTGENAVQKAILKCGVCYLQCLEKITDYVNESAFSYMAVSGESFCGAAWHGFLLQVKHIQKFAFANSLASAFIFIGKVGVTVGNCFSFMFIIKLTNGPDEQPDLIAPLVVVAVLTYLTTVVFLNIFDAGVLGLMTAMAFDLDLHNELRYGPPTFHTSITKIDAERLAQEEADAEWRKGADRYL